MYKKSRYNYVVEKENELYVYNFLHRTFVKIKKDIWDKGCFNDEVKETLLYYGILCNDKVDEYTLFESMMYNELYSKKSLGVFLAMTSECNFSCPYCYQDCRKEMNEKNFIEKENVDILYNYLNDYIEKNNVQNLSLVFFGGEPTLQEEKLIYAINKFDSLSNVNKLFSIITNGYLISDNLIETFKKVDDFGVQITLDGYGEQHDRSRPLKDGKPTFGQIYDNIRRLGEEKIDISVRINVVLERMEYYYTMIDKLADDGMNKLICALSFEAIFDGQTKL